VEQLSLDFPLDSGPRTLVDDATGRIVYTPEAIGGDLAAAWFAALYAAIDWRHERRPMYDRIVDVPRLTTHFGIRQPLPEPLLTAKRAVEALTGSHFNTVGLNLYRDGRDSVAMHNDDRAELIVGTPVALLSLGATRRMRIHSKARPRRTFDVALEPGSLLVMAGAAQAHWEHGIPKTRDHVGPRISLAFRLRPEGQKPAHR
jgi:alkylated DNA repair dioxygenase AlkB